MSTTEGGVSAMSAELGPLPEPLFLLHTGDLFGNERDEWEVQANSGKAVDELAEKQPPGATLGLYDEHTVRQLVAAERERIVASLLAQADKAFADRDYELRNRLHAAAYFVQKA